MNDLLTRRRFLSAIAASVVAAGAPLPVGFPVDAADIKWTAPEAFYNVNSGPWKAAVLYDESTETTLMEMLKFAPDEELKDGDVVSIKWSSGRGILEYG